MQLLRQNLSRCLSVVARHAFESYLRRQERIVLVLYLSMKLTQLEGAEVSGEDYTPWVLRRNIWYTIGSLLSVFDELVFTLFPSMNDERDQTLNQLLVELDGFEGSQDFVLLAATNRPEVLDSALLRPGRLTRKIKVSSPDEAARCAILQVHLRNVPMDSDSDKTKACLLIAKLTFGFSGAELANVVNEGALLASREDRDVVLLKDLIDGVQRTRLGLKSEVSADSFMQRFYRWMAQYDRQPKAQPGA